MALILQRIVFLCGTNETKGSEIMNKNPENETKYSILEAARATGKSKNSIKYWMKKIPKDCIFKDENDKILINEAGFECLKAMLEERIIENHQEPVLEPPKTTKEPVLEPPKTTKEPVLEPPKTTKEPVEVALQVLREQLATKDQQIKEITERLAAEQAAHAETRQALTASQALHAGTLQRLIDSQRVEPITEAENVTNQSVTADIKTDSEQIVAINDDNQTVELRHTIESQAVELEQLRQQLEAKRKPTSFWGRLFGKKKKENNDEISSL